VLVNCEKIRAQSFHRREGFALHGFGLHGEEGLFVRFWIRASKRWNLGKGYKRKRKLCTTVDKFNRGVDCNKGK